MKKKNDWYVSDQRIKELKDPFRLVIEKYLIEHECSNKEVIALLSMALYEIFESIAAIDEISHNQVWGAFVKSFGVLDYLKKMKEG